MKNKLLGISYKNYLNTQSEMEPRLKQIVKVAESSSVEIFVCPSIGVLESSSNILKESKVSLCAQNIGPKKNGAFTGELSIESLIDLNGKFVELGHYERMTIFKEDTDLVKRKLDICFENGVTPLLCIGEPDKLDYSSREKFFKHILFEYFGSTRNDKEIVIAYEPWWAIGKAKAADSEYVHESHEIINKIVSKTFEPKNIRIIYGGSVSPLNARKLLDNEYVDGLFVGRFGHDVNDFIKILNIVEGE